MNDREKVIEQLTEIVEHFRECRKDATFASEAENHLWELQNAADEAIALLKEQGNEYENGFNDAMLGKQELMYEGTDGKWHKKDW